MLRKILFIALIACFLFTGNIAANAAEGPKLVSAVYTDLDNNGVGQGDRIELTFDKTIVISNFTGLESSISVSNGSLGVGATFASGSFNTQLAVTLGIASRLNIAGVYPSDSASSGIGISSANKKIIDMNGNIATPSSIVDITSAVGPRLISAVYTDYDNSGSVNKGDLITLTFDKNVKMSKVMIGSSDFLLPVAGNTLGTGSALVTASADNQVNIYIGEASSLNIAGVFNASNTLMGSASGIGISPLSKCITDYEGNASNASNIIDIASKLTSGPRLISAIYTDSDNNNSVNKGDHLLLTFDKNIKMSKVMIDKADFSLPVSGDTLGTGAARVTPAAANQLNIYLGEACSFNVAGIFNASNLSAGSASGIDISSMHMGITDLSGNLAVASNVFDIAENSSVGPHLISAIYVDCDNNGLNKGDRIILTFDKAVKMSNEIITNTDFLLPVEGDSLGKCAGLIAGSTANQLNIFLGEACSFKVDGIFSVLNVSAGSPSSIDISPLNKNITDLNGNFAQSSMLVDIATKSTVSGPRLVSAILNHVTSLSSSGAASAGDTLTLSFDKAIVTSNLSSSDFVLFAGNTLGVNPTFKKGKAANELVITLGAGSKITKTLLSPMIGVKAGTDRIKDLTGNFVQASNVAMLQTYSTESDTLKNKLALLKFAVDAAQVSLDKAQKKYDSVPWFNVIEKVKTYFELNGAKNEYNEAVNARKRLKFQMFMSALSENSEQSSEAAQQTREVEMNASAASEAADDRNITDNAELKQIRANMQSAYKEYVQLLSSQNVDNATLDKSLNKYKAEVEKYNEAVSKLKGE